MLKGKKKLVFTALAIALIGGGIAIFILNNKKNNPSPKVSTQNSNAKIQEQSDASYDGALKNAASDQDKLNAQYAKANYLFTTKRYADEATLLKTIDEKIAQSSDENYAGYLRLYAELSVKQGDYDKAESYIKKILEVPLIKNSYDGIKVWQQALDKVKQDQDPFVANTNSNDGY